MWPTERSAVVGHASGSRLLAGNPYIDPPILGASLFGAVVGDRVPPTPRRSIESSQIADHDGAEYNDLTAGVYWTLVPCWFKSTGISSRTANNPPSVLACTSWIGKRQEKIGENPKILDLRSRIFTGEQQLQRFELFCYE